MNTTTPQHEQPQPITNLQILQMIQSGVPVANIANSIDLEKVQDTATRVILRTALAAHIRIVEHISQQLSIEPQMQEIDLLKFDDQ